MEESNKKYQEKEIVERTFKFGVRAVNLANSLPKTPAGFAIGNQIVKSGTSIGANLAEAQFAQSKKEFIKIVYTALKESRETKFWLLIIIKSDIISHNRLNSLLKECEEIICILATIVKKSRINS